MQALSKTFLAAAPALHAGQAKQSTLPVSQQQLRHKRPLAHVFAVEASLPSTPTPIPIPSSLQAPNLTDFTLVSLGLVVLFWIGNYVMPDFIFKKLSGSDVGNKNDSEKQKVLDGLVGGTDKTSSQVASGTRALASSEEEGAVSGTGFGKRVSKVRKGNK